MVDFCKLNLSTMFYAKKTRKQPKLVFSRSLKSVGPNATLVVDNVEVTVRKLKADMAAIEKSRAGLLKRSSTSTVI